MVGEDAFFGTSGAGPVDEVVGTEEFGGSAGAHFSFVLVSPLGVLETWRKKAEAIVYCS